MSLNPFASAHYKKKPAAARRRGIRWLRLCGLLFGLTTAGMTPALAADPGDGPGCLGVAVEVCVGWLRATMKVDERFLAPSMARRHQTDVNGRPLGGGLVTVNAELPGHNDVFVILLHLRPDDTVRGVDSNLLYGLVAATTAAEYDRSGLYEVVRRVLGRRCPGLAKSDLYRFFENSVKPRIAHQRQDLSSGLNGLHRILSYSGGVPFCGGITFSYTNKLEWRGGESPQAAAKRTQFSYIELQ
jgi:hypothetical protein